MDPTAVSQLMDPTHQSSALMSLSQLNSNHLQHRQIQSNIYSISSSVSSTADLLDNYTLKSSNKIHHNINQLSKIKNDLQDHYANFKNIENSENFLSASNEISMEIDRKFITFSPDQITCMAEALQQKNDIEKLTIFLFGLPTDEVINSNEVILRARATVAFHRGSFHELYALLENNCFSVKHHSDLQTLWFKAHYKEAEKVRGRPLGAVDKYRLRKKYPLPKTIWDGEDVIYCFKEKSRNALKVRILSS